MIRPPITWPANRVIIKGPAPTCGISHEQQGVDLLQGLQGSALPASQADDQGGQGADAPKDRVADTRVVDNAADFAVHREMNRQDHPQEYGEEVEMYFHFRSSINRRRCAPTGRLA
jgi:hypothetical protein